MPSLIRFLLGTSVVAARVGNVVVIALSADAAKKFLRLIFIEAWFGSGSLCNGRTTRDVM